MKKLLLAFIFIFPLTLNAQNSTALEVHEVDSAAVPNGGYSFLEKFISINRQIPYMAKVAKVNGSVFVSGVVDEKGHILSVNVLRGLRPDCDKEAIRVFKLFNAWKPALKNGIPIAQKVSHRILFKSTENINFVDGEQLTFMTEKFMPANQDDDYVYTLTETIDTLTGLPVGDKFFFKKKNLISTFSYKKDSIINHKPEYPENIQDSTLKIYTTRNEDATGVSIGDLVTYYLDGSVCEKAIIENGKSSFPYYGYYKNGMVREYINYVDSDKKISESVKWYPNGQMLEVIRLKDSVVVVIKKNTMAPMSPKHLKFLMNQWNERGIQNVKDGNGMAVFKTYNAENQYSTFTETGIFKNYKQNGIWKGYSEDKQGFSFKDQYENGMIVKGVAYYSEVDSSVYSGDVEISPEFKGGIDGYRDFLQNNLKYPRDAQKADAEGKAYLQFVVCTDGSLCDFQVLKSAGYPSLDKEALRVIQKSSGLWTPGIQRGRKVRARYTIPINFKLR